MMPTDDLEELERAFWFGDADFYRARLTPDCTMIFPQMGLLDRNALIAGIESGPRWSHVEMAQWRRADPAPGIALVSYRASANREGMPAPYRVWCGSLYVPVDGEWRMAFHQQTPA